MIVGDFANYQGIPCKEVSFRRSDGLAAESQCYVVVDYADLKALRLQSDLVPWRGTSETKEDPGGISIHVWHKLRGTATIADTPKTFRPAASGLKLYGPLVLYSSFEGGGGESITYSDVYVTNASEISGDLAHARLHDSGEIRIDLTDIRQFYSRYGPLIGRINCHLRSGAWDPTTIKKAGRRPTANGTTTSEELRGTPWSFVEVMTYLFSQLPGSPRVSFGKLTRLPAPEEIDQIGAPVATVIQGLLDDYRLVAKMLPHGNFSLARKGEEFLSPGEVARSGKDGRAQKVKLDYLSYEVKSVAHLDVPTVVMVLGRPRVRRRTEPYVPVFQDLDGYWYRLAEIDKVWDGYDIEKVNRQASKGTEKNFPDVPPRPPRRRLTVDDREATISGQDRVRGTPDFEQARDLHYRRRDILRAQAYRVYAPAALFTDRCARNAKGALRMLDPDDDWIEFLPLGDAPFVASALETSRELGMEPPRFSKGRVVLTPPIVRGYKLGPVLEVDPNAAVAMLDQAIAKAEREFDNLIKTQVESKTKQLSEMEGPAEMAKREFERITKGREDITLQPATFLGIPTGTTGPGGSIWGDAKKAMAEVAKATQDFVAKRNAVEGLKQDLEILKEMGTIKKLELLDWKKRRGTILQAIREEGGVHVPMSQMPYGIIPQSGYTLDATTGLLTFDELVCVITPPIVHDPNSSRVMGDGMVTVTFGFESHWNEPSDHATVLFGRQGNGGVEVIGVSATSPVKPAVVHDPELVMYEDDRGIPLNMDDCIDQAAKKAAGKVTGVRTTEGYSTDFSGFVECTLAPGVDSVQHVFAGDQAHTHVAVNAPNSIGPAGPAAVRRQPDIATPARQAAKRSGGQR